MQKKLLFILNQINGTTGQERIIALKTDYFIRNYNYEIVIVTLNKEVETKPFFEYNKAIKFYSLGNEKKGNLIKDYLKSISRLQQIIQSVSPSAVDVCIDNLHAFYLPILLKSKVPFVLERHCSKKGNLALTPNTLWGKILKSVKNLVMDIGALSYDKVVLLSSDHLAEWKWRKNILIINNPLIFYPDQQAKLNNKIVLAVGRHTHAKGFDYLLKSWSKVIESHKDWTLMIYGKKDNEFTLQSLASKCGISNNVKFYDPVSNIQDVYLNASIFSLSSRYEGFPLVLIEAMACGVPPVAFSCPNGVKELITNGTDGLLVTPGDTSAFSDSIINLIENPELRKKMGNEARKNILKLSPQNIFPKWKNLFENELVEK